MLATHASTARGDFVLSFEGEFFDTFFSSPPFTTADRISGTITFEDFDNSVPQFGIQAQSVSLSTTINGNPGFTFTIADALIDSRVDFNSFDFDANSLQPTLFNLTLLGDAIGGTDGDEYLSITDIGDEATFDFAGLNERTALSPFGLSGSFTAIPEPSSLMLLGTALSVGCLFRRQRTKVTS